MTDVAADWMEWNAGTTTRSGFGENHESPSRKQLNIIKLRASILASSTILSIMSRRGERELFEAE